MRLTPLIRGRFDRKSMTLNSPDKIFENPVRALKINLNHDNLRNVNRLNTEL